jgi:hypothetical protein
MVIFVEWKNTDYTPSVGLGSSRVQDTGQTTKNLEWGYNVINEGARPVWGKYRKWTEMAVWFQEPIKEESLEKEDE